MVKNIKQLIGLIIVVLSIFFIIFVINQTAQLVNLAGNVSPLLGQIVLYALLFIYAAIIIVPVVWICKMPRTLFPPEQTDSKEYKAFVCKLGKRLAKNPHLEGVSIDINDLSSVESALKSLNIKADERIKAAASSVFIMTAISQYGALDAFIVLLAQLRMVWQVTTLYNQRPALRELAYLYSNVFATAFLAGRIENLDLLEDQLEPVIASIIGGSLSSLTPALNTATSIVTNSVIEGSANAFLTLRVGIITKLYCASLIRQEKGQLRQIAAVQAISLLGKVLAESAFTVSKIVFKAAAKAGTRPFRYGQEFIVKTSKNAGKKSEEIVSGIADNIREKAKKWSLFSRKKADPTRESKPLGD